MNKLGWILFIVVIVAIIGFWKRPKTAFVAIAPKQCMFHVDDHWSLSFQEVIIRSITNSYESSRSPDDVISKMAIEFPEIDSMQAQICSSDKICFHVDGLQPVFLLNDTHVVVASGHISNKADFAPEVQSSLPCLVSQQVDDVSHMVRFVQQLPAEIASSNKIMWQNLDTIILSSQSTPDMQCIVRAGRVPTVKDVRRCHELYQELLALRSIKKSNKKVLKQKMEYDVRFKNQIIVRPGG